MDCKHKPACPSAEAADHGTASLVTSRAEQGWGLLCNGVVVFEDGGGCLPDGQFYGARRPTVAVHK